MEAASGPDLEAVSGPDLEADSGSDLGSESAAASADVIAEACEETTGQDVDARILALEEEIAAMQQVESFEDKRKKFEALSAQSAKG